MSAFDEGGEGESARDMELLVLTSMYEEVLVVDEANPFAFVISLLDLETADESDKAVSVALYMSLPADFPASPPSIQVQSTDLSKLALSSLSKNLAAYMANLDPEDSPNLTLEAINYCTEQVATDAR